MLMDRYTLLQKIGIYAAIAVFLTFILSNHHQSGLERGHAMLMCGRLRAVSHAPAPALGALSFRAVGAAGVPLPTSKNV